MVYPGLASHPQHELLKRLANPGYGFGGMLTVELGSLDRAKSLMERLQNKHGFGLMAVSLGYFDTLMSASAASTSSELDPAELAAAGISGGLVRISVGVTGTVEQRWGQLEEAYRSVAQVPASAKPTYKAVQVRLRAGIRQGWPTFLLLTACCALCKSQPAVRCVWYCVWSGGAMAALLAAR